MTVGFKIRSWLVKLAGAVIPATAELTEEMRADAEAFGKRAAEVWLDYHENALWARNKLDAGLVLTEEALVYMERELVSRRLAGEARKKNLEPENVELPAAKSDGEPKSAGDGERDVSSASEPVPA